MKHAGTLGIAALLLGLTACAVEREPPTARQKRDATQRLRTLEKSFEKARHDYYSEWRRTNSRPDTNPFAEFMARVEEAADEYRGDDRAIPFLGWMISNDWTPDMRFANRAITRLLAEHASSAEIHDPVQRMQRRIDKLGRQRFYDTLDLIVDATTHESVRATVLLVRAKAVLSDPESRPSERHGATQDLKRVAAFDLPVAKQATRMLFEQERLQIGMRVPEIVADDLAGKPLKLSAFGGKVVVLHFWGSWAQPCLRVVDDSGRLASRIAGERLAIVGVCGDADRSHAAASLAKRGLTWPSFWNGPKGNVGPISMQWNVSAWPTVFVIDHKGVIRWRGAKIPIDVVDGLVAQTREAEPAKR